MDWSNQKVLITGGAGFIGTSLADYLLANGTDVTILDNFSQKASKTNIAWLRGKYANFRVIQADILDEYRMKQAVKNKTIIFHEAALNSKSKSQKFLDFEFNVNAKGCLTLLETMRLYNPEAIAIVSSTSKVYGPLNEIKLNENETRYVISEPDLLSGIVEESSKDYNYNFASSKATAEDYFLDYYNSHNIRTIVFRQSSIFGPLQTHDHESGWLSIFLKAALGGKSLKIYGSGKQVRDILYIDDLINAYEMAISNISVTNGQIYNVGGGIGNSVSLLEVIKIIERELNKSLKVEYNDWLENDQKFCISNIQKAYNHFGWSPRISVKKGIQNILSFSG